MSLRERKPLVVGGLAVLLVVLWLPFPFHSAPRFAGSLLGGLLGVLGAALMLVPFGYSLIKRIPALRTRLSRRVPMRTLLTWHIYAGILGPILGVLHSGHDYQSALGVSLLTMTLVVALSGFVGSYLHGWLARASTAKRRDLAKLRRRLDETLTGLRAAGGSPASLKPLSSVLGRNALGVLSLLDPGVRELPAWAAVQQAEVAADLETALQGEDALRRLFRLWLDAHLVLSAVLYGLLVLHISVAIHYGLRWLD